MNTGVGERGRNRTFNLLNVDQQLKPLGRCHQRSTKDGYEGKGAIRGHQGAREV